MKTKASVVIPTRNRVVELTTLLLSLRSQTVPLEILVMDDGANDETKNLVECKFPEVSYYRIGFDKGPTFQRNRGIELATNNIVFPLDDDTELQHSTTIEQTLAEFGDSRVAAVGIPYVNTYQDAIVRQKAPGTAGIYLLHAFIGAAHALRRDVFLRLGGYREHYFYMGEEGDLCLRMLEAGFLTVAGRAAPIRHLESVNRSMARAEYYGRRNDILFVWYNAPFPLMPVHLIGTAIKGFLWSIRVRRPRYMWKGAAAGFWSCLKCWRARAPVMRRTYSLFRHLKQNEITPLSEVDLMSVSD